MLKSANKNAESSNYHTRQLGRIQAAVGGIPLAMGISNGQTILTVSVLAILITAPIGALAIELSYQKLLIKGQENVLKKKES